LGEAGITKLFSLSLALHADQVKKAKEVMGDTTVQEKNPLSHLGEALQEGHEAVSYPGSTL
jgi:hypothetical protein